MAISLGHLRRQIVTCQRCARLRAYCARVALEKRPAFRDHEYWGRPVPGFGDPRARILVLGLAPAAHGANRTGRVFTGDRSGDFLIRVMHEAGLANRPTSSHAADGLTLTNAYISSVVRCAPPDNKPTVREIANCSSYLEAEITALHQVRVVVALGRVAFDAYWRLMAQRGVVPRPRPRFTHGMVHEATRGPSLVASYHPSQQNTNTGTLTEPMLADAFIAARTLAGV